MRETLRLGRIAGIPVGMHWSLLVVFWLITLGLAAGRFPQRFPGYVGGWYWTAAVAAALLFYASLLAHETGHALVARSHGMKVEGITLWLFGGVAKLRSEAVTPQAELQIAGVGPLISIGAAAVFALGAVLTNFIGAPELLVGSLAWLAVINAILAAFNLAPAAPLDGGRILRAWLWARHGDRVRAAVTASRAGRVLGFALTGLGLVDFAAGAGFGGLWFVFLGWFLLSAARAEESQVLLREALQGLTVRDVMTPDPSVVPDWLTVEAFIEEHVFRNRFSAFPVVDIDDDLVGLVTLARVKSVPAERRRQTLVRDVACPPADVPTATPDEMLLDVLASLPEDSDGRALVLDDGRLVGIMSPTDIARAAERAALRERGAAPAASAGADQARADR